MSDEHFGVGPAVGNLVPPPEARGCGAGARLPRAGDVELMGRIAADEAGALAEFYDRYHQRVYALAHQLCHDRGRTEAVVQETFLAIWRNQSYDPARGQPASWIFTIARHRALDALRLAHRTRRHETVDEFLEHVPARDDVSAEVIAAEASSEMRERLGVLPAAQRQVVCLAFYGELTGTEISEQLGIPLGTVKSRMRLALARLRGGLSAADGAPEGLTA